MKRNLLIRVFGDSLSLPRITDGIGCADTYPELLRERIEAKQPDLRVVVFNRSRGGASILELHRQFIDDSPYFPQDDSGILIIQCGIVDCAPRPVPSSVRAWIGRLPLPLRWAAAKLLHYLRPYLLRAGLGWAITPADRFEWTLTQWLQKAQTGFGRVFVINIAPTVPEIDAHSPGLSGSIDGYNAVIKRVVEKMDPAIVALVDVHKAIVESCGNVTRFINAHDGHHITRSAHQLYAELLCAEDAHRKLH